MLKNYWLIAVRKLWKHKIHAAINVLGLAIGLTACLIIFLITHFELSYDRFHPNGNLIYRIIEHRTIGNHHDDAPARRTRSVHAPARAQLSPASF